MLKLHILRHGNAPFSKINQTDFDRTLDEYGKSQVQKVANSISQRIRIDHLIASPAKRTMQTTELCCQSLQFSIKQVIWDQAIYNASLETLVSTIQTIDPIKTEVLLIGHNPGLSELTNYFSGDFIQLCTAGTISLEFELDEWSIVGKQDGRIIY